MPHLAAIKAAVVCQYQNRNCPNQNSLRPSVLVWLIKVKFFGEFVCRTALDVIVYGNSCSYQGQKVVIRYGSVYGVFTGFSDVYRAVGKQ